ncbi:hypothetical protein QIS74_00698 [Colletotrichum tabaci]|uniref:Uncharacterized protein n=1 Tax=Colletotrichum tabaci TaxID=1209068 RepID=A0AAV9TUU5_9PEZI
MSGHYLCETADSVIEILRDVAIVFFVIRTVLSYFPLTFATSSLLSWVVCASQQRLLPIPVQQGSLTNPQTELVLVPLQVVGRLLAAAFLAGAKDGLEVRAVHARAQGLDLRDWMRWGFS